MQSQSLDTKQYEAYLLLEVTRSDCQISLKQKDLAYEIVHCNTITLQLNCIVLEWAERDLHMVDECISHVHLTIRQSGHPVVPVLERAAATRYHDSTTEGIVPKVYCKVRSKGLWVIQSPTASVCNAGIMAMWPRKWMMVCRSTCVYHGF
ncbi:hypothetical protein BKA83DRAFT_4119919 [Pisolithus microcarpus]|nr:hypothetical protein BKA83DRAFT_4119919 [Pisolithus microcarpus]